MLYCSHCNKLKDNMYFNKEIIFNKKDLYNSNNLFSYHECINCYNKILIKIYNNKSFKHINCNICKEKVKEINLKKHYNNNKKHKKIIEKLINMLK